MTTTNLPRPSRMVRPNTHSISLTSDQRPIDYGHCHMLLKEKYGEDRGDKSYHEIADRFGGARLFVVATEIQKEKIRMISDLAWNQSMAFIESVPNLDDYNYFELWTEWKTKGLYKKNA